MVRLNEIWRRIWLEHVAAEDTAALVIAGRENREDERVVITEPIGIGGAKRASRQKLSLSLCDNGWVSMAEPLAKEFANSTHGQLGRAKLGERRLENMRHARPDR